MPGLDLGRALRAGALLCRVFLAAPLLLQPALAQLSVSDGGTPSYSQAIAVPPGVGGMSPKLSLYYAGGGVNGPLGHGWSVQGLSVITRCAPTQAQDGRRTGVVYQPTDKLCLDGQRLIQTDQTGNPAPQSGNNDVGVAVTTQTNDAQGLGTGLYREFRTEKDIYARIRAYGHANGDSTGASGPAYFRVWTKAGQIYEYGRGPESDTNSALIAAPGKAPIAWAVARQKDTLGNYIDFKYEQRDLAWGSVPTVDPLLKGHEWNILEVQYSGNKVVFNYDLNAQGQDSRTDKSEAYQLGNKSISARRLKSITTYVNSPTSALGANGGTAVRTTQLTYEYGTVTGRSRIKKIQDCAGGPDSARCLPATELTYAGGGNESFNPNPTFTASSLATQDLIGNGAGGVLVGDFNGDGKTDIIYWSDTPANNKLYTSNGDGSFSPNASLGITGVNLFKSDGCYYSIAGDFNGDGISDLMRLARNISNANTYCGSLPKFVLLGSASGGFSQVALPSSIDFSQQRSRTKSHYNCAAPFSNSYLENCIEPGETWLGTSRTPGTNFHLIDVNGDGVQDIVTSMWPGFSMTLNPPTVADLCAAIVCTRVYLGSSSGVFSEYLGTNVAHYSLYADPPARYEYFRKPFVADSNGDGLQDLNVRTGIWLSSGDGNFTFGQLSEDSFGCLNSIDFNGDGRADCLHAAGSASDQSLEIGDGTLQYKKTSTFNLTGLGQELSDLAYNFTTGAFTETLGFFVADINGDGRQDILRWKNDPINNAVYLSNGDGSFRPSMTFDLANIQLHNSNGTSQLILGDFTGRGTAEFLRLQTVGGTVTNRLYVKSDSTPADQLISVASGSGLKSKLYYVPLSNSTPSNGVSDVTLGARYQSDLGDTGNAVTGSVDLSPPMYVVATQVDDTGVGSGTVKTEMAYRGLKADRDGRGLLGFRQVLRQRPGATGESLTVDTRYVQTYPYVGVAASTSTYRSKLDATGSSTLLSSTSNVYCDQTNAAAASNTVNCPVTAKIARPYLYRSVESGQDLNSVALPTITTQNTYNGRGDPETITVQTQGTVAGVAQTFMKSVTNTYDADTTSCSDFQTCRWILGRLSQATVTNTVPNSLDAFTSSVGNGAYAAATVGTGPAVASPLNFVLSNCVSTTPTVSPTPATYVCRLGNTGTSTATNLTYSSTSTSLVVNGPTSCAANTANCGNVTVQSLPMAGLYSGKFSVGTAGASVTSSNITLTVTAPNGLGVSTASFNPTSVTAGGSSTFNWSTAGATAASVSCTGTGVAVTGTSTGTSGSVTVGTTAATTTASCTVTASNASGAQVSSTVDLTVNPSTAVAVTAASFSPTSVQTGQSSKFTWNTVNATSASVSCTGAGATASGSGPSGEINVSTASAGTATCTVTANGAAGSTATGSANLAVSTAGPVLTLENPGNPVSLGTNLTPVAASGADVYYKNTGNAPLTISSVSVSGSALTIWNGSSNNCPAGKVLQPGDHCSVYVYSQAGEGTYSGSITVNSNGGNLTTNVSGTYIGKVALASGGAFGNVTVGQSVTQTVTVNNTASYAIYGLAATATAPYSITSNGCGSTLGAGASCSLTVAFSPTAAGAASGSNYLKLSGYYKQVWLDSAGNPVQGSQAGSTLEYPISLSGAGIPAPSVSSAGFSPTSVMAGGASTFSWNTANATSATVSCSGAGATVTGSGISGSVSVGTTNAGTTTCTVTASNAAGSTATGSANLSVSALTASLSLIYEGYPWGSTVDWGAQTVGTTPGSNAFTLTNSSGTAATGLSVSAPAGWAIYSNNCGSTLLAGASCAFHLRFQPTAAQAYSGPLSISLSNGTAPTFTLTGVGVPVPSVTSASFSPTSVTAGGTSTFSWNTANATSATVSCAGAGATATGSGTSNSISVGTSSAGTATCTVTASNAAGSTATGSANLTVNAATPVLTLESAGNPVSLGTNLTQVAGSGADVYYKNTGTAALTISSASVSGGGLSMWIGSPNNCSAGKVLQPDERCTVYVYSQSGEGTYSGSVTVNSNGGNLTTNVSGNYAGRVALASGGAFGTVAVGQSASQTVTVTNTASYAIYGLAASATAPYSITSNGCGSTLGAGASCTLTVAFSPTAAGAANGSSYLRLSGHYRQVWLEFSGTQTESSQAGSTLEYPISLSGTGILLTPVLTQESAGNPVSLGTNLTPVAASGGDVYYKNTGNAALTISSVSVSGGGLIMWNGSPNNCSAGKVLQPSERCTVYVYSQSGEGTYSGSITVNSNGGNLTTSVSGNYAGRVALASGGAFGNVTVGQSASQTVTVTNTASYAIYGLAATATAPYSITSNGCSSTLGAGASCSLTVAFSPTAAGAASGSSYLKLSGYYRQVWLELSGSQTESSQAGSTLDYPISLSGTGVPTAQAFTVSGPSGNTWTFTNPNAVAVTLTGLSLQFGASGNPVSAYISGGTCTNSGSVAAGGSCTVSVIAPNPMCRANDYSVAPVVSTAAGSVTGNMLYKSGSTGVPCN